MKVCVKGCCKYYQHSVDWHPTKKTFYDWLDADGKNENGKWQRLHDTPRQLNFSAVFTDRYNRFTGSMTYPKEARYAECIDCICSAENDVL